MRNIFQLFKTKLLLCATILLLIFIPLYPKLPLIDIGFTWTYIRVEDFLAALSFVILSVYLIKRKATMSSSLFRWILLFWFVGLVSTVWAFATIGVSDNWAIFKRHLIVLHYLRRIEYLGVFLVSYNAIKTWNDVKKVVIAVVFGFCLVVLYGLGQHFLKFPGFLTMNEEFAKGVPVQIQSGGRVSSTFGGHYDLAGYLVLVIPLIISMMIVVRKRVYKIFLGTYLFLGLYVMILTSSRISFPALLVGCGVLVFLLIKNKKMIYGSLAAVIILTLVLGQTTLLKRFSKTIRIQPVVMEKNTGMVLETPTRDKDWGGLPESDRAIVLPFQEGIATNSANIVTKYEKRSDSGESKDGVIQNTFDIPQTKTKEENQSVKIEIIEEVRRVEGEYIIKNAIILDISFTTRFEGEWPKTLSAFGRHPLLGQGYSTVTSAVDSSYIRALGEVGILGFISFFAIIFVFIKKSLRYIKTSNNKMGRLFVGGVVSGVCGLLVNATLIDIFEASKVAFMLWLLVGVAMWIIEHGDEKQI
ncbi:MAG: O-antigen ligase family protein [bacterium]|nr:O-antigen ligase family protein [bacterium]